MQEYAFIAYICSFKSAMLTKELLNKISNKLDWEYSITRKIFNNFVNSEEYFGYSALDKNTYIEFLKICVNSENNVYRLNNVLKYFIKLSKKNPAELIYKLLIDEVVIPTHLIFDIKDLIRLGQVKCDIPYENPYDLYSGNLAFPYTNVLFISSDRNINYTEIVNDLRYQLIEVIFGHYIRSKDYYPDSESITERVPDLIIQIVSYAGLRVFNIKGVRDYIEALLDMQLDKDIGESITIALSNKYLDRKKINDEKYYFYYCLIEELKLNGYGLRPSFRKAEELLNVPHTTIARRYFDKKKVIQKINMSTNKVISIYHYRNRLDKLLQDIKVT